MAKILSGKDAAADIRRKLQMEVASFGKQFVPGLTIVQVSTYKYNYASLKVIKILKYIDSIR